jgi:biopolymer transport protein TolR
MAVKLPSGAARGRRAPVADINVTPLVDVMLVLLIIFMVTAPLLTAGVPVNLPDSRAKALDQEKQPIELSIDDRGRVFIDKEEVSEADLPQRLTAIAAKAAGSEQPPQIYLRADRSQNYGRVANVMGELSRAGLTRIALVTNAGGEGAGTGAGTTGAR